MNLCRISMKRTLTTAVCALAFTLSLAASDLIWEGGAKSVISLTPPSASGLDELCVVYGISGFSVSIPVGASTDVKWYRYSNLGGAYAEEVPAVYSDGLSSLRNPQPDMGYMVEIAGKRYSFWIIDYSAHPFEVSAITEASEKDCNFTSLDVAGTGDELVYYGINGRRFTLDREIQLSYRTLMADEETIAFVEVNREETFPYLSHTLRVAAPLCPTDFVIKGDRFLRAWGQEVEYTSAVIEPYAVAAITSATQSERDVENEINPGAASSSFGGSAPCEMNFEAAVTDGALFKEWQISRYQDFEDVSLRIQDLKFDYTFTEEGMAYVRFMCANADGSCEAYGDVYTISIGASSLRCPNAFSPNGDGVNDEWKVSYSSIISFECHIFDRYGHRMATLSDPSQGWDGKRNGKAVPTGAYYYVIKAKGADGKNYDLSGDINIVNYKQQ